MKRFEYEVLTFGVSNRKGHEAMRKDLQAWGQAGWEIVSVVASDMHSYSLTVFLKREQIAANTTEEEVA